MSSDFEDFWANADPENKTENKIEVNKIIGFMLKVLIFIITIDAYQKIYSMLEIKTGIKFGSYNSTRIKVDPLQKN